MIFWPMKLLNNCQTITLYWFYHSSPHCAYLIFSHSRLFSPQWQHCPDIKTKQLQFLHWHVPWISWKIHSISCFLVKTGWFVLLKADWPTLRNDLNENPNLITYFSGAFNYSSWIFHLETFLIRIIFIMSDECPTNKYVVFAIPVTYQLG